MTVTEPSFLAAVRESYDTVAADYLRRVPAPAEFDPVARAMLTAFAELVRAGGHGPVADVGCGPGRVTAHLAGLGVPAFGLDLSPRMVELARRAHPELRFAVGSMTALDVADGELGGVLAYFVTHHTPPQWLPTVFAEFHRALAPGGHLLLGSHIGDDEHLAPTTAYGGHPVSYEAHLLPAERIAGLLAGAGFAAVAHVRQEPAEGQRRPTATFLVRRPEAV
jgi:SAM-dependent methyltransferase